MAGNKSSIASPTDLFSGFSFTKEEVKEEKSVKPEIKYVEQSKVKEEVKIEEVIPEPSVKEEPEVIVKKETPSANKVKKQAESVPTGNTPKRLQKIDRAYLKTERVNLALTEVAKKNMDRYAKAFGYTKLNTFINDFFENIDAYDILK